MNTSYTTEELSLIRSQAESIVRDVGDYVLSQWNHPNNIVYKDARDMVTEADINAEKMLVERLSRLVPHAGFIMEEGDDVIDGEYNWIIDPIDQTKNFVGKIPLFFVQIVLLRENSPLVSVVYNPVACQMFCSSSGGGVYLNNVKLAPTPRTKLKDSIVDIELGKHNPNLVWKGDFLSKLFEAAYRIRVTAGTFSLGLLTGGIDAYVALNEKAKIMDYMPRVGLFLESGLTLEWITVNDNKIMICGNSETVSEIKSILGLINVA